MRIRALAVATTLLGCVACGESAGGLNPASPSRLSSDSLTQSLAVSSPLEEGRVPPIRVPEGISCPSDAPFVVVSGFGLRVDIEWSDISNVSDYEVELEVYDSTNVWLPIDWVKVRGVRLEWYGQQGVRYRVRVRSLRCEGTGLWSAYVVYTINGSGTPPVSSPPPDVMEPPPGEEGAPEETPRQPPSSGEHVSWRRR